MSELYDQETPAGRAPAIVARLVSTTTAFVLLFALSTGPAFKLMLGYPAMARTFGPAFEVIYHPFIKYLAQHPYSRIDKFYFWYSTTIWKIPMYRD